MRLSIIGLTTFVIVLAAGHVTARAQQAAPKPNILVIMGDDIGYWNLSTYNQGMMGYRTPNIDSIAGDGMKFTDAYAENSCTAGRSSFITGQSAFRTGLLKVGLPGAKEGLSDKDPTLSELLKPLGYTSGQFGKNHLGDANEFLPTVHGFDEFFGNLYHLNAEEEPEQEFYPKDPTFRQKFGPRGVLHCYATDSFDFSSGSALRSDRQAAGDVRDLRAHRQLHERRPRQHRQEILDFRAGRGGELPQQQVWLRADGIRRL